MKTRRIVFILLVAMVGCAYDQSDPGTIPQDDTDGRKSTSSNSPHTPTNTSATAADKVITNSIGMQLARIPAGTFLMGAADAEDSAGDDERPRHRVRISRPFYLGVYEVTQGELEQVTGSKQSFFSRTGPIKDQLQDLDTSRFPAEQVTWHAAVEFCRRLSEMPEEKRAGRLYRLPTEAEWEYACRAGTETAFAFGDSLSSDQANFNGEHPYAGARKGPFLARTTTVGSYAPNAFGLYDMHGNVVEWCSDWYGREYYRTSPEVDPQGPATGSMRVIRGGEWYSDARDCRSAFRYADIPDGVFYVLGFRVAMTVSDGKKPPTRESAELAVGQTNASQAQMQLALDDESSSSTGEVWPRWRGPRGDGTWHGPKLPEPWPDAGLRRIWQQPVGGGYSGVAVADGRVYTMDRQTAPRELERVLCFHAASGRRLWTHEQPVDYQDISYGNGPRTTPTVYESRVYALGAVGHFHCLDAKTGHVIWTKDLAGQFGARVPIWGMSASPVVFDDLVIVHPGLEPDGCLLAVDRHTGEEAWRSLPEGAGYATPILVEHKGKTLLVAWTPKNVRGLDPHTGELLWTVPFAVTYSTSIATPIYHDGIVLVSGYYEGAKAIRVADDLRSATVIWEDRRNLRGLMCQPLFRNGLAYLLDKRHGLTCFEFGSGEKIWDDQNQMTPKGRNPQATMVWAGDGDRVLVLNSDGELVLARFSREGYTELSRTKIIGPTWAHPAYAGDRVYARDDESLVCVSLTEANNTKGPSPESPAAR